MSHNYYNYYINNNSNNRRQSTGYGYNGNAVATGYAGHQGQPTQNPGWRYWGHLTSGTPAHYQQGQAPQDYRSQVASSHPYNQITSSPPSLVCISKCTLEFLRGQFNVWILEKMAQIKPIKKSILLIKYQGDQSLF